jgi:hypothetical protein
MQKLINKRQLKSFLKSKIKDMSWGAIYHVDCQDNVPLESVLKMIDKGIDLYYQEKINCKSSINRINTVKHGK